MEKMQDEQNQARCCNHNMCGSCAFHGCKNCMLYWLLGLLVLVIAFSMGFKLGELKALYQRTYKSGTMPFGSFDQAAPYGAGQNRMYYMMGGIPAQPNISPFFQATTTPVKK